MRHTSLLTTFAIATLMLSGCSSTDQATSQASQQPSAETITPAEHPDAQAMQKINQLFTLTPVQQDAKNKTIVQCMARKGFAYTPPTSKEFSIHSLISPAELPLSQARTSGYATTELTRAEQTGSGIEAPGAQEAYQGTPTAENLSVEGNPRWHQKR